MVEVYDGSLATIYRINIFEWHFRQSSQIMAAKDREVINHMTDSCQTASELLPILSLLDYHLCSICQNKILH